MNIMLRSKLASTSNFLYLLMGIIAAALIFIPMLYLITSVSDSQFLASQNDATRFGLILNYLSIGWSGESVTGYVSIDLGATQQDSKRIVFRNGGVSVLSGSLMDGYAHPLHFWNVVSYAEVGRITDKLQYIFVGGTFVMNQSIRYPLFWRECPTGDVADSVMLLGDDQIRNTLAQRNVLSNDNSDALRVRVERSDTEGIVIYANTPKGLIAGCHLYNALGTQQFARSVLFDQPSVFDKDTDLLITVGRTDRSSIYLDAAVRRVWSGDQ